MWQVEVWVVCGRPVHCWVAMVKGLNDKQSGYWMFLEGVIRPQLEKQQRRRIPPWELQQLGQGHWAALGYEEKEEWKARAKEFNRSEMGQRDRMQKRAEYRQRKHSACQYFGGVDDDFEGMREHCLKEFIDQYQWKLARQGSFPTSSFVFPSLKSFMRDACHYRCRFSQHLE
ncbi:unnamed protein product [Gongylonema pulchrum]|uniref:HMG box domain-containing protein n=1 Tax=Gongylonema pulchrum TaxID=637853 RepID=A0A183E9K4_9BILA|nr:unnamed protein product [Gongylonema pulchrum]